MNPETKPAVSARQFDISIPLSNNGEGCIGGDGCKSGYCKDYKCISDKCSSNKDCSGHDICGNNGKCIQGSVYDDEECQQNEQCRSGKCDNGKCAAGTGYYGARCSDNNECNDGLICRNHEFLARDHKECLRPDDPKAAAGKGGSVGNPCRQDTDCQSGLECTDQSRGLEKIAHVFQAVGGGYRPNPDQFACTERPVTCTPVGKQCFSDAQCCSNNCKTTQIIFLRQCEE